MSDIYVVKWYFEGKWRYRYHESKGKAESWAYELKQHKLFTGKTIKIYKLGEEK